MTGTDEKPETIGELHDRLPPGIRAHGTGRRWGILFWACPIPGHSDRRGPNDAPVVTVEWDGDVAHCTAPGCGRSSDNEQGCNCEEYDCDGSCCGGQCSCAAATASACPAATTTPRGSPMTSPEPTPDLRTLAAEALNRVTEEAWGEAPDGAGRAILARYVDAVLSAVLPAHRAMVLREAAAELTRVAAEMHSRVPTVTLNYAYAWEDAAEVVLALAATTPPARQDSPGATGEATAVPEEGAGRD